MLKVIKAIQAKATNSPSAPAILNGGRTIPYGHIQNLIARLSNHLIDGGIAGGSRIYFNILDPDTRLIAALACLHAGLIPLWIGNLGGLTKNRDFDIVLGTRPPSDPDLDVDIWIDDPALAGAGSDNRLRDVPDRGDNEVLFIAGTSGTTGERKLVVERRGPFEIKWRPTVSSRLAEDDRVLVTYGDATKYGFTSNLNILANGAVLVRSSPAVGAMLANINRHRVTRISTTPSVLDKLIELMETSGTRAPSLKQIVLAGSLFPTSLVQRTTRVYVGSFGVAYGSAEFGGVSYGRLDAKTFEPGYVGELLPDVELIGVGTSEAPAPIVLGNSRNLVTEYYSDGAITRSTAATYQMPDIGYLKGDRLFLIGRNDEVLNLSGEKIAFSAIEKVLRQQKGLGNSDIGMVAIPADWDIMGIIVGLTDFSGDSEDLANLVSAAVGQPGGGRYFHFIQIPTVPRNQMGKVDRSALLDAYRSSRGQ